MLQYAHKFQVHCVLSFLSSIVQCCFIDFDTVIKNILMQVWRGPADKRKEQLKFCWPYTVYTTFNDPRCHWCFMLFPILILTQVTFTHFSNSLYSTVNTLLEISLSFYMHGCQQKVHYILNILNRAIIWRHLYPVLLVCVSAKLASSKVSGLLSYLILRHNFTLEHLQNDWKYCKTNTNWDVLFKHLYFWFSMTVPTSKCYHQRWELG